MKSTYVRIHRLMNERMMEERVFISLKKFLALFLKNDQKSIVNTIIRLHKFSSTFIFSIQTLLFFSICVVYANPKSVFIGGLFSVLITFYTIFNKYKLDRIEFLKTEFTLLIRIKNKNKKRFIIKVTSYDIVKNVLLISTIPYFLAIVLLVIFFNAPMELLSIPLLFFLFNYFLSLIIVNFKIAKTPKYKIRLLMIPIYFVILFVILSLYYTFDLSILINLNMLDNISNYQNLENIFNAEFQILLVAVLSLVIYIIVYTVRFLSSMYYLRNITLRSEIDQALNNTFRLSTINTKIYQRLIMRAFYTHNRLSSVKIGSLCLSLVIILLHPLLSEYPNVIAATHIFLFSYTPSLLLLIYTILLYDELISKKNIYTTYYLQKKYNCKKRLTDITLATVILKTSYFTILPQVVFLIVYRPINPLIGIICYVILYFSIAKILIFRIYDIEKYTIDQITLIDSKTLTAKWIEDTLVIGLPIIYAMPMVILHIIKGFDIYWSVIPYTIYVAIIYLLKQFLFSYNKGGPDAQITESN